MKKYNRIMAAVLCVYLVIAAGACGLLYQNGREWDRAYRVEINRILYELEESGNCARMGSDESESYVGLEAEAPAGDTGMDLSEFAYVRGIDFLDAEAAEDGEQLETFFNGDDRYKTEIRPLVIDGKFQGYVAFYYEEAENENHALPIAAAAFTVIGIGIILLLLYVRNFIMKPFLRLGEMPYELSKGNLQGELPESRNRYFGKFIWGISMLRDTLRDSRKKELRLEKEKKLLLLSLSHDIKTPLNTIRLYAKALEEGVYDTEEKRVHAAVQITKHAGEIDDFVKEIVKSSSEDILSIEVKNSEFYIRELVEMIRVYYAPKCRLNLTELEIGDYENKLLKGDLDRAFEAVENIMENAFKYGDGRRITITFREEEYHELVEITNTGTPVKKEELVHLFDSFYRGDNTEGKDGSGLGLYICREIMKKMNGSIFAEGLEGAMRFTLVFEE